MKLLTEQQFKEVQEFRHYETYVEQIKAAKIVTLAMIADAIYSVMSARLPHDWRSVNSRERDLMYARHYGRYIAYNYTSDSVANVTRHFGGRDHSVIYNSLNVVRKANEARGARYMELQAILTLINQQIEPE